MKKIITVVLAVLSVLSLSLLNASAEEKHEVKQIDICPEITAHIANKDGARLYFCVDNRYEGDEYDENNLYFTPNTDDVVPFDTKVTVTVKYTVDSVDYYGFYIGEDHDLHLYAESADISFDSPVKPSETDEWGNNQKFEKPKKYYAVNPDGAYLYSGPNTLFDKVSEKIPFGTEITCDYYSGFDEGLGECEIWAYTFYKGVYGWAYVSVQPQNHPDFARDRNDPDSEYNKEKTLYFVKDTPIFRDLCSAGDYYYFKRYYETEKQELLKNNKIGTVPKNTQLDFDYYCHWEGDLTVHISYEGTDGWVNVGQPHMGLYSDTSVLAKKRYLITDFENSMKTYSEPGNLSSMTKTAIPPHCVLVCDYRYASDEDWGEEPDYIYTATTWYRVNYSGEYLWITSDDDSVNMIYSMDKYEVVDPEKIIIYSEPDESSEASGKVATGDTVYLSDACEGWNIIRFGDNQLGWIKETENDSSGDAFKYIENDNYDPYDYEIPVDLSDKNNRDYQETVSDTDGLPFNVIAVISVVVIITVIIAAAVIIIKRKKKNS